MLNGEIKAKLLLVKPQSGILAESRVERKDFQIDELAKFESGRGGGGCGGRGGRGGSGGGGSIPRLECDGVVHRQRRGLQKLNCKHYS